MKKLFFTLLFGASLLTAAAQEKVYQVDEVSVINYGDGRLLFRQINEKKTPLNGDHRIIDGYHSEYLLATFKDGMYHGDYKHFKSNKLKEEGTYADGRKEGPYKEYYSDGVTVKKEAPYKEGKLNGVVKTFYTDGRVESEKGYAMSVEDGVERAYEYEGGAMTKDRNYKGGKLHGKQMARISSNVGQYVEYSTYEMGKRVGPFAETFTNGLIFKQGSYNANGEKDGEWLIRDSFSDKDNGKFGGERIVYDNGRVVSKEAIKDFAKYERKIK